MAGIRKYAQMRVSGTGYLYKPISERTARKRDTTGVPYEVVFGSPHQLSVRRGGGESALHFGVDTFDPEGRLSATMHFSPHDDRLFLGSMTFWEYWPEGLDSRGMGFSRIDATQIERDGSWHRTVTEPVRDTTESAVHTQTGPPGDTDWLWEDVPEFGHWESLARWERDRAVAEQPDWWKQAMGLD